MTTAKAKQFHLIDDIDVAAVTLDAVESVENVFALVTGTIKTWVRRSNDRRQLAMMNERLLNDIGLSRIDLDREIAKYFWQK